MGRRPLGKERINITLPKGMAQALTNAGAAEGRDRSELLAHLSRQYLEARGLPLSAEPDPPSPRGKRKPPPAPAKPKPRPKP